MLVTTSNGKRRGGYNQEASKVLTGEVLFWGLGVK